MPSEVQKGVIKPLAPAAIPLIAWRLRDIAEPRGRLLLEGLHSCTNCHSFSRDGKTLGMDVDGPENDKGTYAIVAVAPRTSIRTQDVITWNSFPRSSPTAPPSASSRKSHPTANTPSPLSTNRSTSKTSRTTVSCRSSIPPAASSPSTTALPAR